MMVTDAVVDRARALIGTRFRAQGRKPGLGLDCVGLIAEAHRLPLAEVRRDYALRGNSVQAIERALGRWFSPVDVSEACSGDVLLMRVGGDVLHLGLCSGTGLIHAHARHGVVERPLPLPWSPVSAHHRRSSKG